MHLEGNDVYFEGRRERKVVGPEDSNLTSSPAGVLPDYTKRAHIILGRRDSNSHLGGSTPPRSHDFELRPWDKVPQNSTLCK